MYALFAVIFAAMWKYIGTPPPIIKNTGVQDIEANISTTTEEDGNISTPREIHTITRLPVPTQHISVASFKASQGPEDYRSYYERQAGVVLILPRPSLLLVLDREEDE